MATLVLDPPPVQLRELLEHRRRIGADRHDEMWEGVLHVAPAPHSAHGKLDRRVDRLLDAPAQAAGLQASGPLNIGDAEDYRVPDAALLRPGPEGVYLPTAALVVEIVSQGDESREKLPFYAAHHVNEVLIVDPATHKVDWLALCDGEDRGDGEYRPVERSGLIDLGPTDLAERIDWPPSE